MAKRKIKKTPRAAIYVATAKTPSVTVFGRKINASESVVSLVLGLVIVFCSALIAYFVFAKYYANNVPKLVVPTEQMQLVTNPEGELNDGTSAVALPTTHVVLPGENLWQISEYYYKSGYNESDIMASNGITNPDQINAGQTLVIPKVEAAEPVTVDSQMMSPTVVDSSIVGKTYTVLSGDSLWSIALRAYGDSYRWTDLAKANKLRWPDHIEAGSVISIPR